MISLQYCGLLACTLLGLSGNATAAPAAPNLVVITLDTTRADHLGAWGWAHARTPNLDALAARGTRFARCDSAAPVTLPSHSTIFTGLLPPRHRVRDNGTFALTSDTRTLAEHVAAAGYDTAAVVSAVVLARRHGLDQGFRIYEDDLGTGYAAGTEVAERQADVTTAVALSTLAKLKPPYLLWVHYYDPHEEYRPPSRFADRATGPHRLYDGEISFVDEQLGLLLAKLPPNTIVAVVGDHGEMLGEHGETSHGLLLFAGARRVPLLFAGPGVPTGRVVDCLTRTSDVTPSLLSLAGLTPPAGLDGRSLFPLAPEARCDRVSYSESFLPYFAYRWYPLRALSDGLTLYLQAPKPALFDLSADPGEQRDLASTQPATARSWGERLRALLASSGESIEARVQPQNLLTADQRKQLEALGYLGALAGGHDDSRAITPALPDPRAMTDLARDLHLAADLVQQQRCAEALPKLQPIIARDPHNFPALTLAGNCLQTAGRPRDALPLFRRANEENPLSAVPVVNIASALRQLGQTSEAEREYRRALTLDPALAEAATNLARIERESGRLSAARGTLESALRAGAHSAELHLELGTAAAEAGDLSRALSAFREASRRDPTNTVALENAARAAFQLGKPKDAAILYEQLLRIDPKRLESWKTLGAIYVYELGDAPAAAAAFRQALRLEQDPTERQKLEALLVEIDR